MLSYHILSYTIVNTHGPPNEVGISESHLC